MPGPSSSRSALSSRGAQLAAATLLGVLTVLLVAGVIALGAYEAYRMGTATWLRP